MDDVKETVRNNEEVAEETAEEIMEAGSGNFALTGLVFGVGVLVGVLARDYAPKLIARLKAKKGTSHTYKQVATEETDASPTEDGTDTDATNEDPTE